MKRLFIVPLMVLGTLLGISSAHAQFDLSTPAIAVNTAGILALTPEIVASTATTAGAAGTIATLSGEIAGSASTIALNTGTMVGTLSSQLTILSTPAVISGLVPPLGGAALLNPMPSAALIGQQTANSLSATPAGPGAAAALFAANIATNELLAKAAAGNLTSLETRLATTAEMMAALSSAPNITQLLGVTGRVAVENGVVQAQQAQATNLVVAALTQMLAERHQQQTVSAIGHLATAAMFAAHVP